MQLNVSHVHGTRVLEYSAEGPSLSTTQDAITLIGEATEHGAGLIVLPASRLSDDFFRLRTGVAGNFLQKFVTYGVRIAILGDFAAAAERSPAFRDLIRESNRGHIVWFLSEREELETRLAQSALPDRSGHSAA